MPTMPIEPSQPLDDEITPTVEMQIDRVKAKRKLVLDDTLRRVRERATAQIIRHVPDEYAEIVAKHSYLDQRLVLFIELPGHAAICRQVTSDVWRVVGSTYMVGCSGRIGHNTFTTFDSAIDEAHRLFKEQQAKAAAKPWWRFW